MGQEPGSSLTGSSASILHKVVIKLSAGVVGSFEGSVRENLLPRLLVCLAEFSSDLVGWRFL